LPVLATQRAPLLWKNWMSSSVITSFLLLWVRSRDARARRQRCRWAWRRLRRQSADTYGRLVWRPARVIVRS
jgi:hypothetical protein